MDIDNKLPDTDESGQESNESQEGDLEEIFDDSGNENVEGDSALKGLSLDQLSQLAGRKVESVEDFQKHYSHLKGMVGDQKRVELEKKAKELDQLKAQAALKDDFELSRQVQSLKAEIEEDKFLRLNPTAEHSLDLVKSVAKAKDIPLAEAWDKHVKEIAEGHAAYKKEKDIGVESKNRISPMQSQKITQLVSQAKTGSGDAQDALVSELLRQGKL